ncbi:hypothetical protein [Sphingomonas xinjiangensis]|uniref:Uncharacterized protein n=1 Tax=Sphingomonas xinjiangensis TaxID=643568 RepID=A0A840YF10_9SPHN|nr:hypothetical protein [Sphingomonas xinjiangensis]MBB5709358.1 hypothetical protein [Sphingomonas xinjiangensis]
MEARRLIVYVDGMRILIFGSIVAAAIVSGPASAQTARGAGDQREAYGARMTPEASDQTTNSSRVVNRLNTRLNSRLSTRIERYAVTPDATDALRVPPADPNNVLRQQVEPVPQDDDPL